jgi:hypothetical protein
VWPSITAAAERCWFCWAAAPSRLRQGAAPAAGHGSDGLPACLLPSCCLPARPPALRLPADALVMGLYNPESGQCRLNPPPDQLVQPGDELVVMRPERWGGGWGGFAGGVVLCCGVLWRSVLCYACPASAAHPPQAFERPACAPVPTIAGCVAPLTSRCTWISFRPRSRQRRRRRWTWEPGIRQSTL